MQGKNLLWSIVKVLDAATSPEQLEQIDRSPFADKKIFYRVVVSAGSCVNHKLRIKPVDLPNFMKDSGGGTITGELNVCNSGVIEFFLKRLDEVVVVTTSISAAWCSVESAGGLVIECWEY